MTQFQNIFDQLGISRETVRRLVASPTEPVKRKRGRPLRKVEAFSRVYVSVHRDRTTINAACRDNLVTRQGYAYFLKQIKSGRIPRPSIL